MKKVLTIIAVLHVFMSNLFNVNMAMSEDLESISNHTYGMLAVVTDLDLIEDLVSVSNWNGDVWQFYGVDDWCVGDLVVLVMHDNSTKDSIYDDIILSAYYERLNLVTAQTLPRV